MFYCLLATVFAQAAITLRFAAASTSFGVDYSPGIQDICCHGEKSVDRLFPLFCDSGTVRLRDVRFDSLRAAARYVFPLRPLEEISERTSAPKAVVIPDVPFDVHRLCVPPRWRACEIVFIVLTIVYGTFFSTVRLSDLADEPVCRARFLGLPHHHIFGETSRCYACSRCAKPPRQYRS